MPPFFQIPNHRHNLHPNFRYVGERHMVPPMGNRRGGILARLFGNRPNAYTPFQRNAYPTMLSPHRSTGGGILNLIKDPNSIQTFLTNTQKVLNTVQQVGPMVQQYGPLVRNLPAMWRLYRGIKEASNENESENEENIETVQEITNVGDEIEQELEQNNIEKETSLPSYKKNIRKKGESIPKLYI